MRTIALIARGALIYQNRPVAAGEVFHATPIDAAVLHYKRQVDFAPRGARPSPRPHVPPFTWDHATTNTIADGCSPATVRRHEHDKQARAKETPAPPVPDRTPEDDVEDPPAEDGKPRKRRQYRRRDLTAEE